MSSLWIKEAKADIYCLREALQQQKSERALSPLVQLCCANYKKYVDANVDAIERDTTCMLLGTWKSPLEVGFLWMGGWRPTAAVVLVFSLMGIQMESELWKILEGIEVPSMATLSAKQLSMLNALQQRSRLAEDDLSNRLALIQMLVADQEMVKASESRDLTEVREAMEPKLACLRDLLIEAEVLRFRTLEEMARILTAVQAAQFIVAAYELVVAVKNLGEQQRCSQTVMSKIGKCSKAANLQELASKGLIDELREALSNGANPSEADFDGRTPLHLAAEKGHVDCVALLIKEGANVNKKDNFGTTPLTGALKGGHDAAVQILMESGAEAYLQEPGIELCKATASGDVQYVQKLLNSGIDPNVADYMNSTPLHIAAAAGIPQVVELLMSRGADVLAQNWHGSTPLDEARNSGSDATVKILEDEIVARQQESDQ
ncbi:hypothetical protein O6H91_22G035100 [Diphasiastrum complanatum]|uniref:Uncharacterized protein n=2 Tax=Diphasiastrum complanatum TaxID=34168 RepID=A0ACC2AED8_DIPCM|nr:hypothetical protein O6H91_22G035100 [Diphasiastrum complanatum]KAJ7515939.1 hypothetical protein O6H91_22G035100 [Diphasiastrum complanatum]